MGPEESMAVQAALGSDIALAFDECTPFHADRDYTARSTERTHRWLDRCLDWHAERGPATQAVFGIVQGGVHEDLRRESAEAVSAAAVDGLAIGGTLGRDKPEMHGVARSDRPDASRGGAQAPARDRRARRPAGRDRARDRPLRLRGADPARPPRHGARAAARRRGFASTSPRRPIALDEAPLVEGCPCPTCAAHTRAYLHYLARAEPQTAARLLTLHNLAFLERLVAGAREAIRRGSFGRYREALLAGAAPWESPGG